MQVYAREFLADFWFSKRGVGGRSARCSARNARRKASFYLSSFAMRWTVLTLDRSPGRLGPTAKSSLAHCCDLTSLERQLAPRPRRTLAFPRVHPQSPDPVQLPVPAGVLAWSLREADEASGAFALDYSKKDYKLTTRHRVR